MLNIKNLLIGRNVYQLDGCPKRASVLQRHYSNKSSTVIRQDDVNRIKKLRKAVRRVELQGPLYIDCIILHILKYLEWLPAQGISSRVGDKRSTNLNK